MQPKYGFIGLGIMGAPMASNLARAASVLAFDTQETRFEAAAGTERAASIKAVAEACGVVFLSLPSSEIVRSVVIGPDGLIHALQSGATVIDTSTTDPKISREIAAELEQKGIGFLDAPVSGGEKGAKEATLSFMVGGQRAVFDAHQEAMRAMGSGVTYVGPVGSGGVAKLVNNMIVGAAFSSIAEGFALAIKNGLEPLTLYEAIRGGWAGSKVLDVCGPQIANRDFTPGGTVEILAKDLGYAKNLARECQIPIPVTAVVDEMFTAAKAAGHTKLSQSVLVTLWDSVLGEDGAK